MCNFGYLPVRRDALPQHLRDLLPARTANASRACDSGNSVSIPRNGAQDDEKSTEDDFDYPAELSNIMKSIANFPLELPTCEDGLKRLHQWMSRTALAHITCRLRACGFRYTRLGRLLRVVDGLVHCRCKAAREDDKVLQLYLEISYIVMAELYDLDLQHFEDHTKKQELQVLGREIPAVLTQEQRRLVIAGCSGWTTSLST
ncbi:hypothetical protein QBC41DRAFT_298973 [Cercophora samala]|uniref:Uncharacterized protein n=1 Tax=Cercophora samala TaxID=330535 RepID=A0AA39ZLE4_9PEZI|nr:hypothetical protein QBC41DRAFT_298973 [Cercophora samala]